MRTTISARNAKRLTCCGPAEAIQPYGPSTERITSGQSLSRRRSSSGASSSSAMGGWRVDPGAALALPRLSDRRPAVPLARRLYGPGPRSGDAAALRFSLDAGLEAAVEPPDVRFRGSVLPLASLRGRIDPGRPNPALEPLPVLRNSVRGEQPERGFLSGRPDLLCAAHRVRVRRECIIAP